MNLTPRRSKRSIFSLLFLVSLSTWTVMAQKAAVSTPCVNQSPRQVKFDPNRLDAPEQGKDYNFVSNIPLVDTSGNTIVYQRKTLVLCDRHYHIPVENIQGCPNETAGTPTNPPPIGQWVEVHTVYALEASTTGECAVGHDHELKCCLKPPFVVVGYSALIADHDAFPAGDHAEWAGSATKEDPATGCNSTPAEWHFALGCQNRLTQTALQRLVGGKPHKARDVQGPDQVSSDLTLVGSDSSVKAACRNVSTQPIPEALATRICPGVCKWPLNQFTGTWKNEGDHAVCQCCPLPRPQ
jgi:hypothetical protein